MVKKINKKELTSLSKEIRKSILQMVRMAQSSHVGSAFSVVDILLVLYKLILKNNGKKPDDPKRDRLILSKGHACTALYAVLAEVGYFKKELLKEFAKNGSIFMSHINCEVPGVEFSTGSLGHGLPVALGIALAARIRGEKWKTFAILSDGELNEGSNWEAFLLAAHLKIDNLFVIVDCNKLQATGYTKDVIDMNPLDKKLKSFGWDVIETDGHDFQKIYDSFKRLNNKKSQKPKIIIANTIKGKGISFMENKLDWHYRWPSAEEFECGIKELK